MKLSVIYTCDVCGCKEEIFVGCSYDGTLEVNHGNNPKEKVYMCHNCASDVMDYIERLREGYMIEI